MLFETFNPDDRTDGDKKLSVSEKALIFSVVLACKAIIRKAGKAETYGDLYKIADTLEKYMGGGGILESRFSAFKRGEIGESVLVVEADAIAEELISDIELA